MADWQNGLFGCFNNVGMCVVTYFVPCFTFGKNAEALGESCPMYGCAYLVPGLNLYCLATVRGRIRDQKGIPGSCCNDLLLVWFCNFCTLIQEGQEIRGEGGAQAQSIARE